MLPSTGAGPSFSPPLHLSPLLPSSLPSSSLPLPSSLSGGGFGWMSGAINVALNWRWTFRVLGVGGLVLVPLAAIALWEPKAVREQRIARQEGKTSYSIKVGAYHDQCGVDV